MSGLISGPFRAIFSFLLGIALFLALWETALFNVSARQTAVGLMTEAGVGLINPALEHSAFGTFGLSESGFASLQALAAARPDDPVAIPGLNVEVRGREITGTTLAVSSMARSPRSSTMVARGRPSPCRPGCNRRLVCSRSFLSWAAPQRT
jgi:hypothetical protein